MQWQGIALVFAGIFLSGVYQVTNKKLLVKQAPPDCVSTVNYLVSGILLLTGSFLFSPPKVQNWFDWPGGLIWPLAATSLLNIIIGFGMMRALAICDASLVVPISSAQPMIVLIPSILILGERPTTLGYFGLFALAIGTYFFSFSEKVLVQDPVTKEKKPWEPPVGLRWLGRFAKYLAPWQMLFRNKGVRIALLVACCGAVAVNFDKLSVLRSSAIFAPGFILMFLGIVGGLKVLATGEWRKLGPEHRTNLMTNPLIFVVVMVCYWTAFHYGLAAYIGALKRLNILVVLLLSWFVLKEQGVKKRWAGATVMATGAALLSV